MNGNSAYHVDPDGSRCITGVTFPVKVCDLAVSEGSEKQITDERFCEQSQQLPTEDRQQAITEYTGKDALFRECNSYSYYVLSEAPCYYKELTVGGDGSFAFSAMSKVHADSTVESKRARAKMKTEIHLMVTTSLTV